MKNLSFSSGGITLKLPATSQRDVHFQEISSPKVYILPLKQDETPPCEPLVKKKSKLKVGSVIGENGLIRLYSPCVGEVKEIQKNFNHFSGERIGAIVVESKEGREKAEFLPSEGILAKISASGIADTQEEVVPLIRKLEKCQREKIKTILINGLEEVIPRGSKHYILKKDSLTVIKGIQILRDILGDPKTIVALYGKNVDGCDDFLAKCSDEGIEVVFLKNKYPQHRSPLLVRSILKEDYPLPSSIEETLKVSIFDLMTAYDIGRIIENDISFFERIITVADGDLSSIYICSVKIGTPIRHVLKELGAEIDSISKVVINGPLSGRAISNLDYPITKEISQIFYQTKGQERKFSSDVCIKCGLCVEVCPMNLMPFFISGYAESKRFEFLSKYNIFSCIECGCCTYVCPVSIPLVQWIKYGKHNLLKNKES